MKRDMGLVRRLMLDIESRPAGMQTTGIGLYREGDDQALGADLAAEQVELAGAGDWIDKNGEDYATRAKPDTELLEPPTANRATLADKKKGRLFGGLSPSARLASFARTQL
ncbi:hypothetical protein [Pseudoxanthomonas sp. Root630]|uniref:hypothetical protein n=1 Tax=Pseudoxanthomonas sp. Root630 TaxID=1736574 RepID=UPI000703791E|nr:hypothetical protein [Pseudoxanthomonas sp. Root630]KRA44583.1 hypothetical protein ASD72_11425 [Pseudoxanthomonas sp. Root630]